MLRRLVLDVLKPHEPRIVPFTKKISEVDSVDGVTANLMEIDEDVRTVRVAVEGEDLDMEALEATITDLGGSIHSIDEVSYGEVIVEDLGSIDG